MGVLCRRSVAVLALVGVIGLCGLAWADGATLPWHLREWNLRQVVALKRPAGVASSNTAVTELQAGPPLLAEDGRDLRVMDEKGRPVRCQWVNEQGEPEATPFGENKRPLVHFEIADAAVTIYLVYFGNPKAPAETHAWEKKIDALVLETRVYPKRNVPRNWREMTALLARSNWKYGEGRRRQINDTENPFGPNERFLSIYRGSLACPKDGEYGFATDSDDASFMLIDGTVVVQWPGGHSPSGKFDHYGTITLKAGQHRIEYYHVQAGGGSLTKAGWRVPGTTEFITIPEEAFVREVRTKMVAVEQRDSPLNAFFVVRIDRALQFGGTGPVFTTVALQDLSRSSLSKVVAWEWDLGDGTISREKDPRHIYHGGTRYDVALKCVDQLGYQSAWRRRVSLDTSDLTRADIAMEASVDRLFAMPGEPVRVDLKFRNAAGGALDLALVTEYRLSPERVLRTDRETVTLKAGQWLTREVFASRATVADFEAGDVSFRLDYLDTPVLARKISICHATDPEKDVRVTNGRLTDEEGARVVLRLSGPVSERQGLSVRKKLRSGDPVHIVAVDATLLGSAASHYLNQLPALLKERFPRANVRVTHIDPAGPGGRSEAVLRGLMTIGAKLAKIEPDIVILPGSLRDVLRFTPAERFKRTYHALVDRIQSGTDAEILLLTPPPTIANPKLAQAYAMKVKEIGLLRGLPVADAFSTFMKASGAKSAVGPDSDRPWRRFYRDPDSDVPMYYVAPAPQGQKLIAEAILSVILSEPAPSP